MTSYPGSFSGSVMSMPVDGLDYAGKQTVYVFVKQAGKTLAEAILNNVNDLTESKFNLSFNYDNVVDPCQLIFELRGSDTFNRDFPITISNLEVDELYQVDFLKYIGQVTVDGSILDTGNSLWCTGQLVYNFLIPVSQMVIVYK